jgi:hypothetical protein
MRYTGGGHKRYRIIDFKRTKKEFLLRLSQLNMIQIVLLFYCIVSLC